MKTSSFSAVTFVNRLSSTVSTILCIASICFVCLPLTTVHAGYGCSGVLTTEQQSGFDNIFSPAYSAKLIHVGGRITEANMSKQLTKEDLNRLQVPKPILVTTYTLNAARAEMLKTWLNQNASATLPGWIATTTSIVVPQAWVGLTADVFIQLINGSGDAGRIKVANLAGTVSSGGLVGVAEQVANDSSGKPKFLWTYLYQANLNGKQITTPLTVCSADIVTH